MDRGVWIVCGSGALIHTLYFNSYPNGSAVSRLMGARGLLGDIEWAFCSKAWLTGRPSCQRMGKQGACDFHIEIHHVKVF